jgi:hypothetical protein
MHKKESYQSLACEGGHMIPGSSISVLTESSMACPYDMVFGQNGNKFTCSLYSVVCEWD